jgi:anti-sigma-K factor RskA
MAVMTQKQDTRAEISMLLPWYAAGTLNASETRRIAAAIERDPELAKRLEDIREEAAETLLLNETIAAPSRRIADKLFAGIEAEQTKSPRVYAPKFNLAHWLAEKITVVRPQTLAFATVAAMAVIALQAGLIAGGVLEQPGSGFQTATAPDPLAQSSGPQLLVSFAPSATAADIEMLLKQAGGIIVDGPSAGVYRLRIGPSSLDQAGVEKVIQMLRDKPEIVRFVAPAS